MLHSQCCSFDQQFRLCAIIVFIPITCHMKVLQYTENDVSMQNTIHFVHICTVINPGCIIKATVVQSCLTCDKRRRKLTISYCVRCNKTHFVLLKMYHFCISKIAFGATKHFQHPYAIQMIKFRHIRSFVIIQNYKMLFSKFQFHHTFHTHGVLMILKHAPSYKRCISIVQHSNLTM